MNLSPSGISNYGSTKSSDVYISPALATGDATEANEDSVAAGLTSAKDDFRLCYLLSKTVGFSVKNKLVYAENIDSEFV